MTNFDVFARRCMPLLGIPLVGFSLVGGAALVGCDRKPVPGPLATATSTSVAPSASARATSTTAARPVGSAAARPAVSFMRMPTSAAATTVQLEARPYAVGDKRRIVRNLKQVIEFDRAGKKSTNRLDVHEDRVDTITAVTNGLETGITVEFLQHRIERQRDKGPVTNAASQVAGHTFRVEMVDKRISLYEGKDLVGEKYHRPLRRRFARFGKARYTLTKTEEHRVGARFAPAEQIAAELVAPSLAADVHQGRVVIKKLVASGLREQPDYVDLAISVHAMLSEPMRSRTTMMLQGTMRMSRKTGRPMTLVLVGETDIVTSANGALGASKGHGETRLNLTIGEPRASNKEKAPPTRK